MDRKRHSFNRNSETPMSVVNPHPLDNIFTDSGPLRRVIIGGLTNEKAVKSPTISIRKYEIMVEDLKAENAMLHEVNNLMSHDRAVQ